MASTDRAHWGQRPDHVKALVEGMINSLEILGDLDASIILKNQILAKRYSRSQVITKMKSISTSYSTVEALRGYLTSLSSPLNTASKSKERLQNAKKRKAGEMMESFNQFGIGYSDDDNADCSPSLSANDGDYEAPEFLVVGPIKKKFRISDMRSTAGSAVIAGPGFIPKTVASPLPHSGGIGETGNVVPMLFTLSWYRASNKVYCIVKNVPHGAEIRRQMDLRTMEVALKFKWDNVQVKEWLARQNPPVHIPTSQHEKTILIPFPVDAVPGIPTVMQGAPDGLFGLEYLSKTQSTTV